jgi:N-acetyl sugar amidotransferase
VTAYRICTRCVMDTTDPDIAFDDAGVCNHCRRYDFATSRRSAGPEAQARALEDLKRRAAADGVGREHDVVIGLSGGVDSSYLAYVTVKLLGLRPIAVHLDNGWNSKLAVKNIQQIVRKLDIDLVTHVIDWEEFKDLQRAYFKAGVIDIEATTDHAIRAILYRTAAERGIKHILFGTNTATEQILPQAWRFYKNDLVNLRAIHARFGEVPLRTFPQLGGRRLRELTRRGIESHSPLDMVRYVKREAEETLKRELGWTAYGGKHYESQFTKIYQGYILPTKFGVDKRRCHLATLVNSGQVTRDEALAELATPPVPPGELARDLEYVTKKLGFTADELAAIMAAPPRSHLDYPTDLETKYRYHVFPRIHPLYQRVRRRLDRLRGVLR